MEEKQLIEKNVQRHKDSITLGETTFPISLFTDLPEKYGSLIMDIIEDEWREKRLRQVVPHIEPFARLSRLATWDKLLFDRYDVIYQPASMSCALCDEGPCDLSGENKGPCGMGLAKSLSLKGLRQALIGSQKCLHQARLLYQYAIEHFGPEAKIDLGPEIYYPTPCIWLITGIKVQKIGQLKEVLDYMENELSQLSASASERSTLSATDLESRTFHAGILSFLAMEVSEIVNISLLGHNSAGRKDLVSLRSWPPASIKAGVASPDLSKFCLVFDGPGDIVTYEVVKRVKEQSLEDEVELCGIGGKAGLKLSRLYEGAKILGIASDLIKFIRLGIPDLLILDGTCQSFSLDEANKAGINVIVTSETAFSFLPDLTSEPVDKIVEHLKTQGPTSIMVLDRPKAAEVALASRKVLKRPQKSLTFLKEPIEEVALRCTQCYECDVVCPADLPIVSALSEAQKGVKAGLKEVLKGCLFCEACERACPEKIPLIDLYLKGSEEELKQETFNMRAGRGPILHTEYRDVAFQIAYGNCLGFITLSGCCASPEARGDVKWLLGELSEKGYAINVTGCAAIAAALDKDENGKTVYERHYCLYQTRGVVVPGECMANNHCIGGDFKLVSIAGKVPLRGNYTEHADYQLNRMGTCVILWGPVTEEFYAMAAGWARTGIPVIVGPHGNALFERFLMGDEKDIDRWWVYQGFTGKKLFTEPGPAHLIVPVETKEEALLMLAKLTFYPNDPRDGRSTRLGNYIETYQLLDEGLPPDWERFLRDQNELPLRMKFKLLRNLKEKGWDVDVTKGKVMSFIRPDGKKITPEEMFQNHVVPHGIFATIQQDLVLKEQTRGEF